MHRALLIVADGAATTGGRFYFLSIIFYIGVKSNSLKSEQPARRASLISRSAAGVPGSKAIAKPAVRSLAQQRPTTDVVQRVTPEQFDANFLAFRQRLAAINTMPQLKTLFDEAAPYLADNNSMAELSQCLPTTELVIRKILGGAEGQALGRKGATDSYDGRFTKANIANFSGQFINNDRAVATVKWFNGDHVFTFVKQNGTIYLFQGWASRFTIVDALNTVAGYQASFNQEFNLPQFGQFLNMMTNNAAGPWGTYTHDNSFGPNAKLGATPEWAFNIVVPTLPPERRAMEVPDEKEMAIPAEVKKDLAKKADGAKNKKGCYITTACVKAKSLPDNCHELTVLRAFRDDYIIKMPEGRSSVAAYYDFAPRILKAIDRRKDSIAVYEDLYKVIRKCVKKIEEKKFQQAFDIYVDMVKTLKSEYLDSRKK